MAAVYWLLEGRKRRADAIASAVAKVLRDKTRSQRQNDYIAPYPNGWYKLSDSEDLRVGQVRSFAIGAITNLSSAVYRENRSLKCLLTTMQVKEVTACGLLLALYRGEDGQARVMDVYCPHMGMVNDQAALLSSVHNASTQERTSLSALAW